MAGHLKILLCDCEGTMPLATNGTVRACNINEVAHHLCRTELPHFQAALKTSASLIVGCTQERPVFEEVRAEAKADISIGYVNIRERAGWSDEAQLAAPKIAALIAEAALEVRPVPTVAMKSAGVTLIYGRDERAIEAAKKLKDRLDLTILLDRPGEILPPSINDVPVVKGRITHATGYLGAFDLVVDDFAERLNSARGVLAFGPHKNGARSRCDIIIDISGNPPLFPAHEAHEGYLRADPGNPAAILEVLLKATDLVGEFEKPQYIEYHADLCAHARSRKTGCTRCIDVCPASAIQPMGDKVAIDPYVCGGCGACASVCPTGAAEYRLGTPATLAERLRTLLSTYQGNGGKAPVILAHDNSRGLELIELLAHLGPGLPARVIPFAVNNTGQLGLDFFVTAFAYGASDVRILQSSVNQHGREALSQTLGLMETILSGLGYGSGLVGIIDTPDPEVLGQQLRALVLQDQTISPASYIALGEKRPVARLGLKYLHRQAPAPVDHLSLSKGAPFGAIAVDQAGCTLCLSCVSACPTGALSDNPERPELSFTESACVQCGLCRNTCPEQVISLVPRLSFTDAAEHAVVLKAEEPFHCISCGKPFGIKSTIEKIITKLEGKHSMFADGSAIERIRMCGDCRVVAQTKNSIDPYMSASRPDIRTTDDYLSAREIAKTKGEA